MTTAEYAGVVVSDSGGGNFQPAPEGLFRAVCVDIVDKGMVTRHFQGSEPRTKHEIQIRWQLDGNDAGFDEQGRLFLVMKTYTASLHEKAKLRRDLEMWRGRKFTAEELKGFYTEKLINVNCSVQVMHDVKPDGRVYANVTAIMPLGKGVARIEPFNYVRQKDRDGAQAPEEDDEDEVDF